MPIVSCALSCSCFTVRVGNLEQGGGRHGHAEPSKPRLPCCLQDELSIGCTASPSCKPGTQDGRRLQPLVQSLLGQIPHVLVTTCHNNASARHRQAARCCCRCDCNTCPGGDREGPCRVDAQAYKPILTALRCVFSGLPVSAFS